MLDQLHLEELDSWTVEQQQSAKNMLVESTDVFSKDNLDLGKCNILKHAIKIADPQPYKERYQRILPHMYEEVKITFRRWLRWVQLEEVSASGPALWCLSGKRDGGLRFCINLCKLNNRTIKDGYSLPRIEDSLDCLHGAV